MVASKRAAPGVDQKGSDVDTNSIIPSSFHSTWVVSHEAKDIFNVETVPLKARLFSLSDIDFIKVVNHLLRTIALFPI